MSIDQDSSLPFVIHRQSIMMTRRDQHGHLHPLSKTQCLSTETTLVSPSSSRDNQVQWHAETNVVVCSLCRRLNVFRSRLLQSPLHHPETIKSNDIQRPMWLSLIFLKTQCLSIETTFVSFLLFGDNQVQYHVETNMVICTLCRRLNVF